jgi:ABC-type multidrug transport system fused ATPase/permease subunit
MAERTSLIIAHRPSTIRHCDQIIHIEAGHLIGTEDVAAAVHPMVAPMAIKAGNFR